MRFAYLGGTGVQVSRISLGTAFFGGVIDESESRKIVYRALDLGINVIDTAEMYLMPSPGASETALGRILSDNRDEIFLATKVNPGNERSDHPANRGLSNRVIVRAIEGSLRRLRTDYVDLLYAHAPDPNTPIEETLSAFDNLVRAGKARYAGLSNFPAVQIVQALWRADSLGIRPIVATQDLYNLFERDMETDLYPLCRQHNIGTFAYSPLAGGLLTGKYSLDMAGESGSIPASYRASYFEQVTEESGAASSAPKLTPQAIARATKVAAWSRERGYEPAQVPIAWILGNPDVTSAILAVKTQEQLEANAQGFDLTLSEAERSQLSNLAIS